MKNSIQKSPVAMAVAIALTTLTHQPALAEQLPLVQYPAGSLTLEPAPNVIVSVDDSGSMGDDGIADLKKALQDTFTAANIPDSSIRLSWQSMHLCKSLPTTSAKCGGNNAMRILDSAHRTRFLNFVSQLQKDGRTPSHSMVRNAGDYLMRTDLGINSPWAQDPGVTLGAPLSCRKSFHVFMTDGAWNAISKSDPGGDADRGIGGINTILRDQNIDKTTKTLPDGKVYSITDSQTAIYRDNWGGPFTKKGKSDSINTLSDLAFYYWSQDLQPSIANNVKPRWTQNGTETISKSGSTIDLLPYWNPKNNPATWQNMTTYTIGFKSATVWGKSPPLSWSGDMYGGDYLDLILGKKTWPSPLCGTSNNEACDGDLYDARETNRKIELWHMAVNGRGKYFPAANGAQLTAAFKEIMRSVGSESKQPVTSYAASSMNNQRTDVGVFSSGYSSDGWSGYVSATKLKANSTEFDTAANVWGNKSTGELMDAWPTTTVNSRVVLTSKDDAAGTGISFQWSTGSTPLTATQQALLQGAGTEEQGIALVKYIRGDLSQDGNLFRKRKSRQGDIVNSNIWYVADPAASYGYKGYPEFAKSMRKRTPMLYVGGNDGMLHGFSAVDGSEKLAYIPKGVIEGLSTYAASTYSHRYFVDGSPYTGDVDVSGSGVVGSSATPSWKTMLVGSLAAGGRGYFVLDVTKPGSTDSSVSNDFTAANANNIVVTDKTFPGSATADTDPNFADIGHIYAPAVVDTVNPFVATQISKMNNGRWAAVMGNGYNSVNERPVLLIQYLDGAKELLTIPVTTTSAKGDNGLSAPRLVDINGDGTPDVVYAGDLKGNLWKFDLGAGGVSGSAQWKVAFGGSVPFFTAARTISPGVSTRQAITTAPIVKASKSPKGLMVAFGTGRNLTADDRESNNLESLYSILDKTTYDLDPTGKFVTPVSTATPATGLTKLVKQEFEATTVAGSGTNTGKTYWKTTANTVNFGAPDNSEGWYIDFKRPRERILKSFGFYDNSNLLEIFSESPASGGSTSTSEESCDPPSAPNQQYLSIINLFNGKPPSIQIMDSNGDGFYNAATDKGVNSQDIKGPAFQSKGPGGDNIYRGPSENPPDILAAMPIQTLRPSWRQLQ